MASRDNDDSTEADATSGRIESAELAGEWVTRQGAAATHGHFPSSVYNTSARLYEKEGDVDVAKPLPRHRRTMATTNIERIRTGRPRVMTSMNNDTPSAASLQRAQSWSGARRQLSPTSAGVVDASSYNTVPESPAKRFLSAFATWSVPEAVDDDEGEQVAQYVLGRQIGHGGFSIVREAVFMEEDSGAVEPVKCAVKIVRKSNTSSASEYIQEYFDHEVGIWAQLHHPHILELYEVHETDAATFAFMPLLHDSSTLYHLVRHHHWTTSNQQQLAMLTPDEVREYMRQLTSALLYLHLDARIVHRDVKLENCLIDREAKRLLLCDFGLAEYLPEEEENSDSMLATTFPNTRELLRPSSADSASASASTSSSARLRDPQGAGGSLPYTSPEQIQSPHTAIVTSAVDIWALGVLMHVLITGMFPFAHAYPARLQLQIERGEWDMAGLVSKVNDISTRTLHIDAWNAAAECVQGCLQHNVAMRWSAQQVQSSAFLKS